MAALESRQVREALAALASRAEPSAAGVASALACAAAASLVELTGGLAARRVETEGAGGKSPSSARLRALADRGVELRERLLDAADEDAGAFAEVMAAGDERARARALDRAAGPPLVIAESAADVAEAAAEIAGAGPWPFRPDAVTAAQLAAAAAISCAELVSVDLGGAEDDPRLDRARAAAARARGAGLEATEPPPA